MQQRCKTKLHQEKVTLQGFSGKEALSAHCPQSLDMIKCKEKVVSTRNLLDQKVTSVLCSLANTDDGVQKSRASPIFFYGNIMMI
jgi:hypothetical protein